MFSASVLKKRLNKLVGNNVPDDPEKKLEVPAGINCSIGSILAPKGTVADIFQCSLINIPIDTKMVDVAVCLELHNLCAVH